MYRWAFTIASCACFLLGCTLDLGNAPFLCNNGLPECPDGYVCVSKEKQKICVAEGSAWVFTRDASADVGEDIATRDANQDTANQDTLLPDAMADLPPDVMPDLPPDVMPDVDPCAGVLCNAPPYDKCHNYWTLRRYISPGTCNVGKCSYSHSDEYCDYRCTYGECIEGH